MVDWPRGVLVLAWRHGGRSEVVVEMTRRRALSRKHQASVPFAPQEEGTGQQPIGPAHP